MKHFLANIFLLFFVLNLHAQITINRSDYPLELNDFSYRVNATNIDVATIPEAGEKMVWDFRDVEYDLDNAFEFAATPEVSDPLFPDANTGVSGVLSASIFPGLTFDYSFFRILDEQGFRTIGRLAAPINYPINALTGTPGDVLEFTETVSDYEEPVINSQFPMNYGDGDAPSSVTLNLVFAKKSSRKFISIN